MQPLLSASDSAHSSPPHHASRSPVCKVAPHKVVQQSAGLAKVKPTEEQVNGKAGRCEQTGQLGKNLRQDDTAVGRSTAALQHLAAAWLSAPALAAPPSPLVRCRDVGHSAVQRAHHPAFRECQAGGGGCRGEVCCSQPLPLRIVNLTMGEQGRQQHVGERTVSEHVCPLSACACLCRTCTQGLRTSWNPHAGTHTAKLKQPFAAWPATLPLRSPCPG